MKFTPILKDFQARVQSKVKTGVPNQLVERADQVLLSLSHSSSQLLGQALDQTLERIESNPHDLIGRVGRQVLQRAEDVRQQLVDKDKPWVPSWLGTVKFIRAKTPTVKADAATAEAVVEPAPAEVTAAPKVRKARKPKATSHSHTEPTAKPKASKSGARRARKSTPKAQ